MQQGYVPKPSQNRKLKLQLTCVRPRNASAHAGQP
jgi:hypothetical protein